MPADLGSRTDIIWFFRDLCCEMLRGTATFGTDGPLAIGPVPIDYDGEVTTRPKSEL